MINYRLLSDEDFASLYDCFLTAFSDYAVDMQMSRDHFQQRIARDGVRLQMSAGAFDDEGMIGFCINGTGEWQGQQTAYDAGTGVIPGYRGRGVAKELFALLERRLKAAGVTRYLLEVLTSNTAAATLYRKLGFEDTRRLAVFRPQPQATKDANRSAQDVEIKAIARPDWALFQSFWDGYPSWQNSIASVERVASERKIAGAYNDGECVGYGVVFVPSANLMQLAVAPQHRRKRVGSTILTALESPQRLKINNIDENLTAALTFYEANDYSRVLDQFEMMKTL